MKTSARLSTYLFWVLLHILPIFVNAHAQKPPDAGAALQGLLDQQVQKQGILGMAMAWVH